jgi:hypothetical protein
VDGAGGGDSGGGVRLGLTLTAPSGSAPFIPPTPTECWLGSCTLVGWSKQSSAQFP